MLKYMKYAYIVYKERSFTRAAERLYISQPSLSQMIKKLETEIGHPIFERSGKEITLTPVGEVYIRAVEKIMQISGDMHHQIDDILALRKGKLVIGSTTFIASYILPQALKYFQKAYPDIEVDLIVEQSTVLEDKLEQGLVDIIIDNAATQNDACEYIPYFTEQILLGVPEGLPVNETLQAFQITQDSISDPDCDYSELPKISIRSFQNEKFILLKHGNIMRQTASRIFQEADVHPRICLEFDLLMTTISYAESGFGVCFLTDTVLRYGKGCRNLVCYLPDTEFSQRTLYVIHKKGKYLSSATREFMRYLTSGAVKKLPRHIWKCCTN